MSDEIVFNVWIGCLACYNAGRLVGDWFAADQAGEVTPEQIHRKPTSHEELWCFDVEAPISAWAREMSPMEATKLARDFEESLDALEQCPWQAYLAFLGDRGEEPSRESASDAEDRYRGEYDRFQDYADELADETLGVPATPCAGRVWDAAMRELGAQMEFAVRYFDYAGHARDMEHYYTALDSETGVYVFDTSY